jgi:hypothetical protein
MKHVIYTTRTAQISLEDDFYIKIKILPGSLIDEEDDLDNLLVTRTTSPSEKTTKLIDIRGRWKMTAKARDILKKQISAENTLASAYLVDNLITKITWRYFESLAKTAIPQKFFKREADAVKWLQQFK